MDLSLGVPTRAVLWDDLIVVTEEVLNQVVAIDVSVPRWGDRVSRLRGEYHWIKDHVIAPTGNLRAGDGRLNGVTEIGRNGAVVRNHPGTRLPEGGESGRWTGR